MSASEQATSGAAPAAELLRAKEAAQLLGIHEDDVYRLAGTGRIPSIRLGRRVRIPRRALLDWIDEQARGVR